jgi:CRISPR-associated protein Cpf1
MKTFNDLTGLYSLSKTLRFELKPVGKTKDNIETKGIIAQDEKRAEEYKKVKDIIDRYHKSFIDMCLAGLVLKTTSDGNNDSLKDYVALASKSNRDEKEDKDFDDVKTVLRKHIVDAFKKGNSYGDLFKKELIQNHLPDFVTDEQEKLMVENFSKFTTYFTGFNENRKNMYSDEKKSTAIAYRLIHENLPMFIDNIKSFAKITEQEDIDFIADVEHSFKEELKGKSITQMFCLENFTETLTQGQIELYNKIVGGRVEDSGVKKQGINEYVNLYNQQHKDARLPLLKPLYKMILSDRVALSWLPEELATDEEMLAAINETHGNLKDVLADVRELLQNINNYDTKHIYIANDKGLTDISQQIFGQYDVYTSAIKAELRNNTNHSAKEKKNPELLEKRINDIFKASKSFSIEYLNSHVDSDKTIQSYYKELGAYDRNGEQRINLLSQIELAYVDAHDVLLGKHTNLNQSEDSIKKIKALLDAYKALQHFIKPLLGNGDEADKDNEFDAKLRAIWDDLDIVTPLYDKVRNRLTRKPYSTEKIKLNFDNAQLLNGWDMNKEPDCTSVLLRKDGQYYLAIMDKKSNHAFDADELPCDGECYEKMEYKQMALPMGMGAFVRKCFGTAKALGWQCPRHLMTSDGKIIIKDEEAQKVLPELIDCYKSFLDIYEKDGFKYKTFNFKFKPSSEYEKLSHFFAEVPSQGYKCSFRNVSVSFINQLVDEGKLYLFQIWNKDFSEYSKGTPNMHTLYWKMLFDERNLANVVYKLNGQAEVFYRKRSLDLDKTTIHRANQPIANKNMQNEKRESTFCYDIVKNRRYTVDKFQFHVPITINFKATGSDNINASVLDVIRNNGIEHIIGIDRGERHLLYLSLIDMKGNIVKQMTLNDIINEYKGNTYTTNYKELLQAREGDRKEARQNWQKIENIKELKEGYLSQVVHVITKMMVEYKAIVVLEDLNGGFMRGRQKIERQVYEKFEKMLIDKLNYYVDKQRDANENGGLLHAYQLASKFDTFKKLGKQSGCLFYIPAWNTSKIDPVTGFVNMFDTRYENADKTRNFFSKFKSISYNADKDWFEFVIGDYSKFTDKAKDTRTDWVLCTYGTRIKTFRNPEKLNQWDNKEIVLTDEFKKVFMEAGIDINGNLKEAICTLTEKKHLESLMQLMKLLVQMRNSETNSEVDYLLSPVADTEGHFYDSRNCGDNLPKDADANGAYNIARKGLWAVMKIKASKPQENLKLGISNKEWLQFAQEKPYLND